MLLLCHWTWGEALGDIGAGWVDSWSGRNRCARPFGIKDTAPTSRADSAAVSATQSITGRSIHRFGGRFLVEGALGGQAQVRTPPGNLWTDSPLGKWRRRVSGKYQLMGVSRMSCQPYPLKDGAPEGIRTPNLLICSHSQSVRGGLSASEGAGFWSRNRPRLRCHSEHVRSSPRPSVALASKLLVSCDTVVTLQSRPRFQEKRRFPLRSSTLRYN